MREINTSDLPKHISGNNKGHVDWCNTVGLLIPFVYDGVTGELEILQYHQPQNKVTIRYGNSVSTMNTYALTRKVHIGSLIGACGHHNGHRIAIGTIFKDDKRNLEITKRFRLNSEDKRRNRKMYSFKCHKCGWGNGEITESDLLLGKGCSCCSGTTVVLGINDIPTTAPWMLPFFSGGYDEARLYTKQSNRKVVFVCPSCGRMKDKMQSICSLFKTRSIGCVCSDGISFPEKFMANVLTQLDIDYIYQFHPDWSENRYFDFYIGEKKLIIEMDGGIGHGHKPRGMYGVSPDESLKIDLWKDKQAINHGIDVVRIDAQKSECDYIKKGILAVLSHTFDLDDINWELAAQFATTNLVKEVCARFESTGLTIKDIALEFCLSTSTIVNYLRQGKRFSWCSYDPKTSKKRAGRTGAIGRKLAIDVYKNDIHIKNYDSLAMCISKGEIELKTKISKGGIHRALKNGSLYKGYIFKYAS